MSSTSEEAGSTKQLVETLGFPENSTNKVVRQLPEILTQGNPVFLLIVALCNVNGLLGFLRQV